MNCDSNASLSAFIEEVSAAAKSVSSGGDRVVVRTPGELSGYRNPRYAYSFSQLGRPRELKGCGGWVLEREIPGTPYKDATGCYPLFSCRDWTKLHEDLEQFGPDIVSLAAVIDPYSEATPSYLEQHFDIVKPFKTHYLADLSEPPEKIVNRIHQKKARRALEAVDVEICHEPLRYLDDWIELYGHLIVRHDIKGITRFSPQCFEIQLNLPGMIMFLARHRGEIVGATLVLNAGSVAYFHLSAYSPAAYRLRAAYATHWKALIYGYQQGIRFLHLGGTAGTREDPTNGLAQFKRGWSNERRTAYFCGRIVNRERYDELCRFRQRNDEGYFPAYRAGEPDGFGRQPRIA